MNWRGSVFGTCTKLTRYFIFFIHVCLYIFYTFLFPTYNMYILQTETPYSKTEPTS